MIDQRLEVHGLRRPLHSQEKNRVDPVIESGLGSYKEKTTAGAQGKRLGLLELKAKGPE